MTKQFPTYCNVYSTDINKGKHYYYYMSIDPSSYDNLKNYINYSLYTDCFNFLTNSGFTENSTLSGWDLTFYLFQNGDKDQFNSPCSIIGFVLNETDSSLLSQFTLSNFINHVRNAYNQGFGSQSSGSFTSAFYVLHVNNNSSHSQLYSSINNYFIVSGQSLYSSSSMIYAYEPKFETINSSPEIYNFEDPSSHTHIRSYRVIYNSSINTLDRYQELINYHSCLYYIIHPPRDVSGLYQGIQSIITKNEITHVFTIDYYSNLTKQKSIRRQLLRSLTHLFE